jgi:hypothetical protein
VLDGKIKLIAWGMKDIAFREKELNYWIKHFPDANVVRSRRRNPILHPRRHARSPHHRIWVTPLRIRAGKWDVPVIMHGRPLV